MAAPHVAGVAALALQGQPTATPAAVAQLISASATHNRLSSIGTGSPNKLLFSGLTVEPPLPTIALNPGALSFSVVRPPAGVAALTAPAAAQQEKAAVQEPIRFRASGAGAPRAEMARATAALEVSTTAATASLPVALSNPGTGVLEWSATSNQPWLSVDPTNGAVASNYAAVMNATVNAGTLAAGTHTRAVTLRGTGATNSPLVLPVALKVSNALLLSHGVPRTGLAGTDDSQAFFVILVPHSAYSLKVEISGGSGDADLYVRYGSPPTPSQFDCRPYMGGNSEVCEIGFPASGAYYVMVNGFGDYSGLTLTATVGGPPTAPRLVAGTLLSPTSVRLNWVDGSVNETSFAVQRTVMTGTGGWSPWQAVATLAPNTTTWSNTTGLEVGATYLYRVRACNTAGCSAWAYSANVVLPGITPPRNLAAVALSATSARVTWADVSPNETSFQVTRRVLTNGTWSAFVFQGSTGVNGVRYDNPGLAPSKSYQYMVRACHTNGTVCSAWAATPVVTTPAS